jgi:hypothetical protein
MFDKTGMLAFYVGGKGFEGPVLAPGTYYTGIYPEIRMVECGQKTVKESLTALTKDGVQFSLDVYISYSANCDEEASVNSLLTKLSPETISTPDASADSKESATKKSGDGLTITSEQIYRVYVRPAIGEAVRESVSPYIANDVNSKREEIFGEIKRLFEQNLNKQAEKFVVINGLNLSNLDFPDTMDAANVERAAQAILKDKSIAEREKVNAQIETAKLQVTQAEVEAKAEAARIDVIGAALQRNREYFVRDVYRFSAEKGGTIVLPADPDTLVNITRRKD